MTRWSVACKGKQRGSVIIMIAMLISLLAFIPIGTSLITRSYKSIKLQQNVTGQATNIARGGLVDAVSWFKNQSSAIVGQNTVIPVPSWSIYDPAANYPYPDAVFEPVFSTVTINPAIGLVKEFPLGQVSNLWARYEVRRQTDPDNDGTISASEYNPRAVHDVTGQRIAGQVAGDGLAWSLESVGYVYRRKDGSREFNQSPNEILATSRVATEIRSLAIATYNTRAAVIMTDRDNARIRSRGRLNGGASDFGIASINPGNATVDTGGQITPAGGYSIPVADAGSGTISPQDVFKVSESELRLLSDFVVNDVASLPADYPGMSLVFINGNATFTSARPLRGGGILYVQGNLNLDASPNTSFGGIIFVTGNVSMRGQQGVVSGVMIVNGNVDIEGAGSDWAEIIYDNQMIASIRQFIGQYRENRATYHVFTGTR